MCAQPLRALDFFRSLSPKALFSLLAEPQPDSLIFSHTDTPQIGIAAHTHARTHRKVPPPSPPFHQQRERGRQREAMQCEQRGKRWQTHETAAPPVQTGCWGGCGGGGGDRGERGFAVGGGLCVTVIRSLPKSQRLMSPRLRFQLQFTTNLQLKPPPVIMSQPPSHTLPPSLSHTHKHTELLKHMDPTGIKERDLNPAEVVAAEGRCCRLGWCRGQQQLLWGEKVSAAAEGKLWPGGRFQLGEPKTRFFIPFCRRLAPPRSRCF